MADRTQRTIAHLPVFEPPEQLRLGTWVQLVRTFYRAQRPIVQVLSADDVTLAQFDLLATLRYNDGVTQQELAERLLVTKGNVCGLIDRLEKLGWVERRGDERDGRVNRLHLTARGRRKVESLLPRHDAVVLTLLGKLSISQIQSLRSTLEEVEKAALSEV
jgi:DNA-binding MarR family transcriptional regulator